MRLRPGRTFLALALLASLAPLLLAACGGGGAGDAAASASARATNTTSTTNGSAPVSDEQYLKTLCTGLVKYQESINTAKTTDAIAAVIKDYITSLKEVTPPGDIQQFHDAYIQYLSDALKDPTSLLAKAPPKPAEPQRTRLADRVKDVPECKYPTFLGEDRG